MDYAHFADRVRTCEQPWSLLFEIQKEWGLPRTGAEVVTADALAACEKRLGLLLPRVLKEWYQLPSNPWRLIPWLCTNVTLPQPIPKSRFATGLQIHPKGAGDDGLIVFIRDCQNSWECGFLVRDAHIDDPPAYVGISFDDDFNDTPVDEWNRECDSLSSWLIRQFLGSLAVSGPGYRASSVGIDSSTFAALKEVFESTGFPVDYGHLYGARDALLLICGDPSDETERKVYLNCRSAKSRDHINGASGIIWDRVTGGD